MLITLTYDCSFLPAHGSIDFPEKGTVDGREERWEGETELKKERKRESTNHLGIVKLEELVKYFEKCLESRIQNRK